MKLSIGVLAYNERNTIGATVASLLSQSVIVDPAIEMEIIIVANGCSDDTADVARKALGAAPRSAHLAVAVRDVPAAGKANAWNIFIHEASASDAEFLVLMDADIEFGAPDAIARLVEHLKENPDVLVAPDQPVKKFGDGEGFLRPFIRALQKSGSDDDTALSGQLYAARASTLRGVRMPIGIVVEDGFLRAMVLTANFTDPETRSRIRRAPGVRHFYRPYETLSSIWRYERRQAAGTAINRFLYDEFRRWRAEGKNVTAEIDRRNAADPEWIEAVIAENVREGGRIVVPRNYWLRRLRRAPQNTFKALAKAPLIAAAVMYDIAVAFAASRQLRGKVAGSGRWDSIRSG